MKDLPDSLISARNAMLSAILQSNIEKISEAFSEAIIYENEQNFNTVKGKQALKKKLVTYFKGRKLALALSDIKITIVGSKALEWSIFTLFIDHLTEDKSMLIEGEYSAIWEQTENEEWLITRIKDRTAPSS